MSYEDEFDDSGDFLESPDGFSGHAREAIWRAIFFIALAVIVVSAAIAAVCSWWLPPIERR